MSTRRYVTTGSFLVLFVVSCSSTPTSTVPNIATGGSSAASGGVNASGGAVVSGGFSALGGAVAADGGTTNGGAITGGATNTAGGSETASGGVNASGGAVVSGGSGASAGALAAAGAITTGGSGPSDPTVCTPPSTGTGSLCGPSGATCSSTSRVSTTNQTYCSHNSWTCVACTAINSACVTANCSDCCSGVFTDGKCIAGPCKSVGTACSGSDCKDCCSGLGFNGVCVQCNANSDCGCPKACANHQCVCTPHDQPCAFPNQNCQDCCSGYFSASGMCTCVPSGTNVLNNACTSLTSGSTCGTFTMTFKNAPGAASACCSGSASSANSCN